MEIDFTKSVASLVKEYPVTKEIMTELGFSDINKSGMLQTAGRYMTIPKGAKMKKLPLEKVIAAFEAHSFEVKGVD